MQLNLEKMKLILAFVTMKAMAQQNQGLATPTLAPTRFEAHDQSSWLLYQRALLGTVLILCGSCLCYFCKGRQNRSQRFRSGKRSPRRMTSERTSLLGETTSTPPLVVDAVLVVQDQLAFTVFGTYAVPAEVGVNNVAETEMNDRSRSSRQSSIAFSSIN